MPEDSAPSTKYLRPASVERSVVAVDGGDDVERQRLQLEAEIERDQVVGRDHHQHAERGEQDEDRELEALEVLARGRSAVDMTSATAEPMSASDLHEAGEAVERRRRRRRSRRSLGDARSATAPTTASSRDRQRGDDARVERSPREDADHAAATRAPTARMSSGRIAGERWRSAASHRQHRHCRQGIAALPAADERRLVVGDRAGRPRRRSRRGSAPGRRRRGWSATISGTRITFSRRLRSRIAARLRLLQRAEDHRR